MVVLDYISKMTRMQSYFLFPKNRNAEEKIVRIVIVRMTDIASVREWMIAVFIDPSPPYIRSIGCVLHHTVTTVAAEGVVALSYELWEIIKSRNQRLAVTADLNKQKNGNSGKFGNSLLIILNLLLITFPDGYWEEMWTTITRGNIVKWQFMAYLKAIAIYTLLTAV